jgi:hypothetical protein
MGFLEYILDVFFIHEILCMWDTVRKNRGRRSNTILPTGFLYYTGKFKSLLTPTELFLNVFYLAFTCSS